MPPHVSFRREAQRVLLALSLAALLGQTAAGQPQTSFATYFGGFAFDRVVAAGANAAGEVFVFGHTGDQGSLPIVTHNDPAPVAPDPSNCFVARLAAGTFVDVIVFDGFSLCDAFELAPDGVVNVAMRSQAGNYDNQTQLRTIAFDPAGGVTITPLRGMSTPLAPATVAADIRSDSEGNTYVLLHQSLAPSLFGSVLLKVWNGGTSIGPILGTASVPQANALAVGTAGKVFVAGSTTAAITTTFNAYQPTRAFATGCSEDGILLEIDTTTSPAFTTTYASYFSGGGCDRITGIVRDAAGHLSLTGETTSNTFIFTGTPPSGGVATFFVATLDISTLPSAQLVAGRYLGIRPSGATPSYDPIVLLNGGLLAISGTAMTSGFPLLNPLFNASGVAASAQFVHVLTTDLTPFFSTHLDNSGLAGESTVASGAGGTLIAVTTTDQDGLATVGTPQDFLAGGTDLLIRSIDLGVAPPPPPPVNGAPEITIEDPGLIAATSPDGRQLWVRATVTDPENDTVDVRWSVPGGDVTFELSVFFPTNASIVVHAPIGTTRIALEADDRHGNVVRRELDLVVNGINTLPAITPVELILPDDVFQQLFEFTPGRMKVTFPSVATQGLTWFRTRLDRTPQPPAGKQLGSAPFYYDLATTAIASDPVRVCVDVSGMAFVNSSQARLHRLESGVWQDIGDTPTPAEVTEHWVCGTTPSINQPATFAIFTPADETTRVTTIIGNGNGFTPGAPAPGDGGLPHLAPVGFPEGLAFDMPRRVAYVSDSFRIRKVDLDTNTIVTIAGTGEFPMQETVGVNALGVRLSVQRLAVDRDGNIFLPSFNGCGIARIDAATNEYTRIAGIGADPTTLECGFSEGDGGLATAARINGGRALAFDREGNLFFQQTTPMGSTIRRIAAGPDGLITGTDPAEIVTTIAGGGSTWPPQSGDPLSSLLDVNDFAFAANGDLYIAGGAFILRLTPAHQLSIVAGATVLRFDVPFQGDNGPASQANLSSWGLDVLPSGDILFTEYFSSRIRRISPGADGIVTGNPDEMISTVAGFTANAPNGTTFNGDGYALSTAFNMPRDIVIDPRGGINILDSGFNRIRRVNFAWAANAPPVANAGADIQETIIDAAALVQLDGSLSADPDGQPLTFVWTGAGRVAFGVAPQLLLPPGTYTFALTVRDAAGATATDTVNVTVLQSGLPTADVEVTVVAPSGPVDAGDNFTVTPTLRNHGPDSAFIGRLNVTLPEGIALVSAPPPCSALGQQITCDVEPLPAGAAVPLPLTLRATRLGSHQMSFAASSPISDPNLANNTVVVSVESELTIREQIAVTDVATPQPAVMLNVIEPMSVDDALSVDPAILVNVLEHVAVTDVATPQPSVMLNVLEHVAVTDVAAPQPSVMLNVLEQVTVTDGFVPVDTVPPVVTLSAPAQGALYVLNQHVDVAFTCTDEGSGIATCQGTLPSGSVLNTGSVGTRSFSVTAVDRSGNAATATADYGISYRLCPLTDLSKARSAGSQLEIVVRLCDVASANYSAAGVGVTATTVQRTPGGGRPTTLNMAFAFVETTSGPAYQLVLKTKGFESGTYRLNLRVDGDPTAHAIQFVLR